MWKSIHLVILYEQLDIFIWVRCSRYLLSRIISYVDISYEQPHIKFRSSSEGTANRADVLFWDDSFYNRQIRSQFCPQRQLRNEYLEILTKSPSPGPFVLKPFDSSSAERNFEQAVKIIPAALFGAPSKVGSHGGRCLNRMASRVLVGRAVVTYKSPGIRWGTCITDEFHWERGSSLVLSERWLKRMSWGLFINTEYRMAASQTSITYFTTF